jgi:hypothetical protein
VFRLAVSIDACWLNVLLIWSCVIFVYAPWKVLLVLSE